MLAAVPVKPFGVAKARLAPVLSARARSRLGKEVAAHTMRTLAAAGAFVAVVTRDPGVRGWAASLGYEVIDEAQGRGARGLDGAARAAAQWATSLSIDWMIVHADLPLLTNADARRMMTSGPHAIAPSHDGGTTALRAERPDFPFAYGRGSFHRHVAALPNAAVVTTPGLALDLDTPRDLALVAAHPDGAWLRPLLDTLPVLT